MNLNVRIREFFAAPPEEVWRALTNRDVLADWLMPNDFVAEIGKSFTFVPDHETPWDGNVECRVIELRPPEKMTWSWKTRGMPRPSRVEFELIPKPGGTQLVFRQDGEADAPVADGLDGGWPHMFARLETRLRP